MSITLKAGSSGNVADVNSDGQLLTKTVAVPEEVAEAAKGEAFNITTESITISGDSALFYIQNNESSKINGNDQVMRITQVHVYVGTGTFSKKSVVTLLASGSALSGTIVSNAVPAAKCNHDFGSSNSFPNMVEYKGVSGDTFTDGAVHGVQLVDGNGDRPAFWDFPIILPQSGALGVKIVPNISGGGTCDVVVEAAGYYAERK